SNDQPSQAGLNFFIYRGIYYLPLAYLYEKFEREQLLVFLLEDLREDPKKLFKEIFTAVDIDSEFSPDIEKVHNISKAARSRLFASKLNWFFSGRNPITPLTKKIIPSSLSSKIRKIALNSSLKEFQKPQMNPLHFP
ncbi:unnamed protein product, partial [marine sediment metagenome]